jgi:hypothetical protein
LIKQHVDKKILNQWFKLTEKREIDLLPLLTSLENEGSIGLIKENNRVKSVIIFDVLTEVLNNTFTLIETNSKHPFPSETSLGITVPVQKVVIVDVKKDFINFLVNINSIEENFIKITFPDNIAPLFLTKELFRDNLLTHTVAKLSNYLHMRMNTGYMYSRLSSILRGSEIALNELLNTILTNPQSALTTLAKPNDFTYRFWAHFANLVLEDFKGKKDLLLEEHGYCQSAFLIGFYNVFQKGVIQKENKKKNDLKQLENFFKKPPYIYSLQDLNSLTDNKGIPYVKKYSQQFILDFLKEKAEEKGDKQLPFIIGLKSGTNKNYFIQRDYIIPFFLQKLTQCSKRIRQEILEDWKNNLKNNTKTLSMLDDSNFLNEIEEKLASDDPLLMSLLNPNLLFVAKETTEVPEEYASHINQCFDSAYKLRPVPGLLNLEREKLYKEVKSTVPFWYTIPLLNQFYFFFKRLFSFLDKAQTIPSVSGKNANKHLKESGIHQTDSITGSRNEKGDSESRSPLDQRGRTANQLIAYKKAMNSLKKYFLKDTFSLEEKLADLAEKWNPLYDPFAKQNLVEDVNSLIRDFIRSFKKRFKVAPPDSERIKSLARELTQNKALAKIKRKEYLTLYIELALIKYLEKNI